MASGKSPHNVDRAPILRSLEQQNAGSFRVVRIVLNDFRGFHTFDKFPCKQPISSDLVVSVLRNSDTALGISARMLSNVLPTILVAVGDVYDHLMWPNNADLQPRSFPRRPQQLLPSSLTSPPGFKFPQILPFWDFHWLTLQEIYEVPQRLPNEAQSSCFRRAFQKSSPVV